jgi:hypothetical protein
MCLSACHFAGAVRDALLICEMQSRIATVWNHFIQQHFFLVCQCCVPPISVYVVIVNIGFYQGAIHDQRPWRYLLRLEQMHWENVISLGIVKTLLAASNRALFPTFADRIYQTQAGLASPFACIRLI